MLISVSLYCTPHELSSSVLDWQWCKGSSGNLINPRNTNTNTPIFTEHLAFKADIQNDWTLCIKFPISELCRQLILLDAGSNYSVIRDFDADNWSCCTLDQITLQIEVCFWNRQLILPFYAGSNYSVLRGLMQTIDLVAHWIKLLCSQLQFYVDNWSCFMLDQIILLISTFQQIHQFIDHSCL